MTSRIDTNHPFAKQIEVHRKELLVHCYRMMGSLEDADDMVQDTLVKAWTHRDSLKNPNALRAWLYKIASNTCLDMLKKRKRRKIPRTYMSVSKVANPIPSDVNEPIWLQPYPNDLLPLSNTDHVEDRLLNQENINLAFMTILHLLPPRQRAILILRDVLEFKASEVAKFLDTSISAVKSALFRARSTLVENQSNLADIEHDFNSNIQLELRLEDYILAWESANIDGLIQLLKEDATFSMPPIPSWYRGHAEIRALIGKTIFRGEANGRWKLYPTQANQQPAFGLYRKDEDKKAYVFYGIQVLTYKDKTISDILTFRHRTIYTYFNLPEQLPFS